MGVIREFVPADSSRIWEHLNHIRDQANPQLYTSGTYNLVAANGTLNGGVAAWGGYAFLTRTGTMVTLSVGITVPAGSPFVGAAISSSVQPLSIPAGYLAASRNYDTPVGVLTITGTGGAIGYGQILTSNKRLAVTVPGAAGSFAAGMMIRGELTWRTNDPVPSTTPGTLQPGSA